LERSGVLLVPEIGPRYIWSGGFKGFFGLPQDAGDVFRTELKGDEAGRALAGFADGNVVNLLTDPEMTLGAGNFNQNRH
jgi:hypothetical protein